jgi:uncharacterized delta-60 repeat protein
VNGITTTDFNNNDDVANSIALQGDKILAVGGSSLYESGNFALARYTADGTLDPSFGVNGKVITDFNDSNIYIDDIARSIALQGDNIVVAGYTGPRFFGPYDFALARYTANGTLDSSFGMNGKITTDFNMPYSQANAIALQGNKILVAGYTGGGEFGTYDIALARYTANGSLDSSFGVNGKVTTDFDYSDNVNAIALQGNKILLSGTTGSYGCCSNFVLARYTANGTLDSSFGVNGKVTGPPGIASAMSLQGNKILVAGSTFDSNNIDFVLARNTADGTLDSFFGEQGVLTGYFPSSQAYFTK